MNVVLRVLIGLVVTALGASMVIRTRWYLDFLGGSQWAEAKLGGGGSNLLYKIVGLVFCFIGIIVTTNLWNWFLAATLGSLLPHFGS